MQNFLVMAHYGDWINQDINFPKEVKSHSEILTYFRNNPCPENIPVIKRALAVFNQFTGI